MSIAPSLIGPVGSKVSAGSASTVITFDFSDMPMVLEWDISCGLFFTSVVCRFLVDFPNPYGVCSNGRVLLEVVLGAYPYFFPYRII